MMRTTKAVMTFVTPACRFYRLLCLPILTSLSGKIISKESDLSSISEEGSNVSNVFWMTGPSISYVASVANPSRGKRGRMRTRRRRIRKSGSVRSKSGLTPPEIIL